MKASLERRSQSLIPKILTFWFKLKSLMTVLIAKILTEWIALILALIILAQIPSSINLEYLTILLCLIRMLQRWSHTTAIRKIFPLKVSLTWKVHTINPVKTHVSVFSREKGVFNNLKVHCRFHRKTNQLGVKEKKQISFRGFYKQEDPTRGNRIIQHKLELCGFRRVLPKTHRGILLTRLVLVQMSIFRIKFKSIQSMSQKS
jgi:hypothetical protein